jgi:LuxR family maltose regulon positive regulatory protein
METTRPIRLPRLLARVDARTALTVLRAPSGFGKTALVRDWLHAKPSGETVAWVTPGAEVTEAEVFWAELLAALRIAGVDAPATTGADLSARAAASVAISAHGRLIVVLDSFERVATPGVERALLDLAAQGTGVRLVVCTRSEHQFADAGGLGSTTLDAARLAWTEQETALAFADWDVQLSIVEMGEAHAYVAGWPALVRAVGVAQLADPHPANLREAVRRAAGRYVTEHLLGQVWAAEQRSFVRAVSVEPELTTATAHLLSGDTSAELRLRRMCADGLLRSYEQDGEARYLWLPVARRLVRDEFAARRPQAVAELDLRLVQWYRENGRPERALTHAAAIGDWALVVRIVDLSWRALLFDHHDVLHQVLIAAPYEAFRGSPTATAARDVLLRIPTDLAEVAVPAPRSRRELQAQGSSPQVRRVLDADLLTMMMLRRKGMYGRAQLHSEELAVVAEAARACRPAEVANVLAYSYLQSGLTRMLVGDLDGAAEQLGESYRLAPEGEPDFVAREAAGKLALTYALSGDIKRAERWIGHDEEGRALPEWLASTIRTGGSLARALVAVDRLMPEAAMAALDQLAEVSADDELWPYVSYVHARYSLLWGDPMAALHSLRRERERHRDWHSADSEARPLLAATEANLLIAMGQGSYVRAVLSSAGRDHPELMLAWARFELLTGDADRALVEVSKVLFAESTSLRLRTEAQLLHAVARHRLGDADQAREAFRRVVRHVKDHNALAYFAMVPRDDLYCLAGDVRETASLLGGGTGHGVPAVLPASLDVVRLTEREQVVLERLAEHRSAPEIATSLYVSVHTVKSQVGSLYRKLGVNCRDHAVVAAREMGLLR